MTDESLLSNRQRMLNSIARKNATLPKVDHNGRPLPAAEPAPEPAPPAELPASAPSLSLEEFHRVGRLMEAGESFENAVAAARLIAAQPAAPVEPEASAFAGSADGGAQGDTVTAPEPPADTFAAKQAWLRDLIARQQ